MRTSFSLIEHFVHLSSPPVAEKALDHRVADVGPDAAVANVSALRDRRRRDVFAQRRVGVVEHRRRVVWRYIPHRAARAERRQRHVRIVQLSEHLRHDQREVGIGLCGERQRAVLRADRRPVDSLELEERVVEVELVPDILEHRRTIGGGRRSENGVAAGDARDGERAGDHGFHLHGFPLPNRATMPSENVFVSVRSDCGSARSIARKR